MHTSERTQYNELDSDRGLLEGEGAYQTYQPVAKMP